MPIKLTNKSVAKIKAPDPSGKQKVVWDTEVKGLGVVVSGVSSSKSYIAQRAIGVGGKLRRVTIGPTNTVTIEQARDQAATLLNAMRAGTDPKVKVANPTLQEALDDYVGARHDLRPESVRSYRRIEKTLSAWLQTKLRDIDANMVEVRHRELAAQIGEFTANGAMRTLSIVWNYAADRVPTLPPNPVRRLRRGRQWYPEPKRTGMLMAEDMPKFYQAVMRLTNEVARDYLIVLTFSGMRRTEAATLRWSDVDFSSRVIRVREESTKAVRKLDLPMVDMVRQVLVARRALGDSDFVFPATGRRAGQTESGHIWDPGLKPVRKELGLDVSCHWLRRGWITYASEVIGLIELKALVNHSLGSGDVTAGYIQVSPERLRAAAQTVCDRLKVLCGIEVVDADNVARLG